ncbi:hypothetical protein [Hymenobacter antarcticus]|uniref:Uncharacterized protein n=1 Tax=Hymenobacter antarcticus TaxID=486270 RepID=A0ABP7PYQ8_9BACT
MDLIVTVPDDRVNFVKKLLRELNLSVKPAKAVKQPHSVLSAAQQQLANELAHSLRQVELHQQGKITLPSAYDLLDEV